MPRLTTIAVAKTHNTRYVRGIPTTIDCFMYTYPMRRPFTNIFGIVAYVLMSLFITYAWIRTAEFIIGLMFLVAIGPNPEKAFGPCALVWRLCSNAPVLALPIPAIVAGVIVWLVSGSTRVGLLYVALGLCVLGAELWLVP